MKASNSVSQRIKGNPNARGLVPIASNYISSMKKRKENEEITNLYNGIFNRENGKKIPEERTR